MKFKLRFGNLRFRISQRQIKSNPILINLTSSTNPQDFKDSQMILWSILTKLALESVRISFFFNTSKKKKTCFPLNYA